MLPVVRSADSQGRFPSERLRPALRFQSSRAAALEGALDGRVRRALGSAGPAAGPCPPPRGLSVLQLLLRTETRPLTCAGFDVLMYKCIRESFLSYFIYFSSVPASFSIPYCGVLVSSLMDGSSPPWAAEGGHFGLGLQRSS